MIVIDTHIFIWWVTQSDRLKPKYIKAIDNSDRIILSKISCWEIAKLVEKGKLELSMDIDEWLKEALKYPKIEISELALEIIIDSTQLPGEFHKDPADQLIVATARILDCPILTEDSKILNYEYVKKI